MDNKTFQRNWMLHYIHPEWLYLPGQSQTYKDVIPFYLCGHYENSDNNNYSNISVQRRDEIHLQPFFDAIDYGNRQSVYVSPFALSPIDIPQKTLMHKTKTLYDHSYDVELNYKGLQPYSGVIRAYKNSAGSTSYGKTLIDVAFGITLELKIMVDNSITIFYQKILSSRTEVPFSSQTHGYAYIGDNPTGYSLSSIMPSYLQEYPNIRYWGDLTYIGYPDYVLYTCFYTFYLLDININRIFNDGSGIELSLQEKRVERNISHPETGVYTSNIQSEADVEGLIICNWNFPYKSSNVDLYAIDITNYLSKGVKVLLYD